MNAAILIRSITEAFGGRMINFLLAGTLLTVTASALLWACSCRSSRTRFAVLFSTLLGIVSLLLAACFPSGEATSTHSAAHITLPAYGEWGACVVWLAGAALGLLRIAVGLLRVRAMRRRCIDLGTGGATAALGRELRRTLEEFPSRRRVSLYVSDDVRVPTAIGFFRPAVLIPTWTLKELSPAELKSILLHELGHLRRWDDWTNLAQKIVRALLFFHPAVWWIDSRLSLEREMACDDLVLANTNDARGYAQCLVSVTEKSLVRSGLALAVAAVSRMRETAVRLTRILDQNRISDVRVSRATLTAMTAMSLMALAGLPRTPALVVFDNPLATQVARQEVGIAVRSDNMVKPLVVRAGVHQDRSWASDGTAATLRTAELRTSAASVGKSSVERSITGSAPSKARKSARIVRTKMERRPDSRPLPVRTSWNPIQQPAPVFLLIVRTADYDATGSAVVSITVWRVSYVQQEQVQSGVLSKAI